MSNIITLSISEEQHLFLKENKGRISPSFLLQTAINEKMDAPDETKTQMLEKIQKMSERLDNLYKYIEEKGLTEEFINKWTN